MAIRDRLYNSMINKFCSSLLDVSKWTLEFSLFLVSTPSKTLFLPPLNEGNFLVYRLLYQFS
jgi:hypothetical protein